MQTVIQKQKKVTYDGATGKPMIRFIGDYLQHIGMPTGKTVNVLITQGRIIISLWKEIDQ